MSSEPINPTHQWFVSGIGTELMFSATQKRQCLAWIAERHAVTGQVHGTKYATGGYLVEAGNTKYLVMPRDVAATNGYLHVEPDPQPTAPAQVTNGGGLTKGQARGGIDATGRVYLEWKNDQGDYRIQHGPSADTVDVDAWVTRMIKRLVHYRITLKD